MPFLFSGSGASFCFVEMCVGECYALLREREYGGTASLVLRVVCVQWV